MLLLALLLQILGHPAPPLAPLLGEVSYSHTYPRDRRLGWTVDLQGVTHDSAAWYFTQRTVLWRIPVGRDLAASRSLKGHGVRRTVIPAALARDGYNHFGALAWYDGLLLIPITGRRPAVIAVVRARDFAYLGHLELPAQRGAGWLAVAPDGLLYSSDSHVDGTRGVLAYAVDWSLLASGRLPPSPSRTRPGEKRTVVLRPVRTVPLLDSDDNPLRLTSMQGGVFDGEGRLYTLNGYCSGTTRGTGISVFAVVSDTGRLIGHSSNHPGPFAFEYHPGHHGPFWCREEPEGLTLWDLDDGRAPGIRGQLHALMIDNAIWDYGALSFRHYRLTP